MTSAPLPVQSNMKLSVKHLTSRSVLAFVMAAQMLAIWPVRGLRFVLPMLVVYSLFLLSRPERFVGFLFWSAAALDSVLWLRSGNTDFLTGVLFNVAIALTYVEYVRLAHRK
jgi:hypothetical protein